MHYFVLNNSLKIQLLSGSCVQCPLSHICWLLYLLSTSYFVFQWSFSKSRNPINLLLSTFGFQNTLLFGSLKKKLFPISHPSTNIDPQSPRIALFSSAMNFLLSATSFYPFPPLIQDQTHLVGSSLLLILSKFEFIDIPCGPQPTFSPFQSGRNSSFLLAPGSLSNSFQFWKVEHILLKYAFIMSWSTLMTIPTLFRKL